jgi:hypothetical protein
VKMSNRALFEDNTEECRINRLCNVEKNIFSIEARLTPSGPV